jgi:serine protease AprX
MKLVSNSTARQKAVWGPKRIIATVAILLVGLTPTMASAKEHSRHAARKKAGAPSQTVKNYKMDDAVTKHAKGRNGSAKISVIVTLVPGGQMPPEFKKFARGGTLGLINGQELELSANQLAKLAALPSVFRIHHNRSIGRDNYRTSVTVGARTVRESLGYTGAGIGIAVIDSGITTWHDDLTNTTSTLYPYGNQRVTKFVDFVNGQVLPYDDNGHGSHVAGIIAGNGTDSRGEKSGIAPGASLISLKVLNAAGQGTISNIIAALGWVAANAQTYNIRVVNMSVGAGIFESYWTDPLTLAAKAITDQGITVVVAAGNMGKNAAGHLQYGGIAAPANAPWVLTVGASSTNGTLTRNDDSMATFSSAGPSFLDYEAKPDLVAPGVGTVSLAVPGSTFYSTKATALIDGKPIRGTKSYLSLSGTSMAAPVVTGTVALMLQANPTLTPNLIKALLQYTAQPYKDPASTTAKSYSALRQGAGFLNALGAVRLAKYYKDPHAGDRMPVQRVWSKTFNWGAHRIKGGVIKPTANAWATNVVWGTAKTLGDTGDNIVWGTACADCGDNIVWGTADDGDNIVWGTGADGDNIVWGTADDGDNIVWGTADDGDNIVWGTDCGGADCDNIVWGTADPGDNIVWGTAEDGDNIVWGTAAGDNIVWGTSTDSDVTWGSAAEDVVIYSDEVIEPLPSLDAEFGDVPPPADPAPVAPPAEPTTTTTVTTSTDAVTGVVTTVTTVTTTTALDAVTGATTTTVTTTTDTTDSATGVTTTTVSTVTV